ncbi:MAG: type III pantothenate kinase [Bacteroidetes bacterium]|nr:type III pantothenate kinase [Bacteroidota bacterium]
MQLVADIGNTAIKFAAFDGESMLYAGVGIAALSAHLRDGPLPDACLIAAVADYTPLADLLKNHNVPFELLSASTRLPTANLYQTPETLGADRLVLAVAAQKAYPARPVLVIAAGTCITYNFVDPAGFRGGAISPGITMRLKALEHYTSGLPYIEWDAYRQNTFEQLIGTDTTSSILSGVLNGVIQEVNGTIEQYKHRYTGLHVAVTGGDMGFLVKNLKNGIFARPDMVLEGLNYILLYNA